MHSSVFFKLFPPPKFMEMCHAGLEISDDAVRCLEFSSSYGKLRIAKYSEVDIPDGVVEGGDIKDRQAFTSLLKDFDRKNNLSYVKVSVPEEKAYLFQTDVPSRDIRSITQNVESKLEENVPLSAADAIFYFDILPLSVTGGVLRVSVSVVPLSYIEHYVTLLRETGFTPMAFEVVPKAIARAVVSSGSDETIMMVHMMKHKAGIYIVSGGVVCFTSTIQRSLEDGDGEFSPEYAVRLSEEIDRVHTYWMSQSNNCRSECRVVLLGRSAPLYADALRNIQRDTDVSFVIANIWNNILDLNKYLPPISQGDSLDYGVVAGLAMN